MSTPKSGVDMAPHPSHPADVTCLRTTYYVRQFRHSAKGNPHVSSCTKSDFQIDQETLVNGNLLGDNAKARILSDCRSSSLRTQIDREGKYLLSVGFLCGGHFINVDFDAAPESRRLKGFSPW